MTTTKFWVALIGGSADAAIAIFGSDTIVGKVLIVVLAGLTAAGVYQLPNTKLPTNGAAKG